MNQRLNDWFDWYVLKLVFGDLVGDFYPVGDAILRVLSFLDWLRPREAICSWSDIAAHGRCCRDFSEHLAKVNKLGVKILIDNTE